MGISCDCTSQTDTYLSLRVYHLGGRYTTLWSACVNITRYVDEYSELIMIKFSQLVCELLLTGAQPIDSLRVGSVLKEHGPRTVMRDVWDVLKLTFSRTREDGLTLAHQPQQNPSCYSLEWGAYST